MEQTPSTPLSSWRRARHRLAHSIKLRMVLVFLLLAAGMSLVFVAGAQRAFSLGWRDAARPLLKDYVDRLSADIAGPAGQPPSPERALAITQRLPITIQIQGPQVQWASHPDQVKRGWAPGGGGGRVDGRSDGWWRGPRDEAPHREPLLQRTTADGHIIGFGIDQDVFEHRPHLLGYALAALLCLTLLAWLYVRHLLKPLDAIGEGARRFGHGDFSQPIPLRRPGSADELGELAGTLNTMGGDFQRMLDAKRALLLAISHELRSPLTRARLHAELLPETTEVHPQRAALLRDLQEMAALIGDLLESERLSGQHAVLHREPTDVLALVHSVVQELAARHGTALQVRVAAPADLPPMSLDPARLRLLIRNLLDNALRHGADAPQPPELTLERAGSGLLLAVRDHGPGVSDAQIPHLAQAFYRPDSARARSAGGVGLGLYLCRLVAEAHGGTFNVRNAKPGLQITATLPSNG